SLQFRITRADLGEALDRTLTTEHFVVHYARGGKSPADVALTGEDLEFRYQQLRETLGVDPRPPITVWEFPDADVKKKLVGAGGAPPLAAVVGAGFSTLAGRRAYTMAGSFSAFLLTTRGPGKLRAVYQSGGNFADVYRVPLADLEAEWRQFLAQQPLTTRERA